MMKLFNIILSPILLTYDGLIGVEIIDFLNIEFFSQVLCWESFRAQRMVMIILDFSMNEATCIDLIEEVACWRPVLNNQLQVVLVFIAL